MAFKRFESLKLFEFEIFKPYPITHAIFTRQGGVSMEPWASLNFGSTVGDDREAVLENHRRALTPFGIEKRDVFDVWQVHGSEIAIAEQARPDDQPHQKADVILTNQPGLPVLMRFADCVPILLYDQRRCVAGMVHAGWQGTVRQAVKRAVFGMQERFGTVPGDIAAAIGPSIGPDHYEVGVDVVEKVRASFGQEADRMLKRVNGALHFDLWQANEWLLSNAGVGMIENPRICTACSRQDWYSHRAENGKTGRFGALIQIDE